MGVREAPPVTIEAMRPEHWEQVARIYADGIATGNATFETEVPSWEAWDRAHLSEHRFVAINDGRVVGWVAVSPVSDRCVYGGVVENSVYVDESVRGLGIGVWTIQTGIFPENAGSVRLHERVGFEVVGTRRRLGKLHGTWRDVLLMERRSAVVG